MDLKNKTFARCALALVTAGVLLGGCNSASRSKYNLALQENQELRQRVVALQSAKEASDERAVAAQREADELAQALRDAQTELDTQPAGGGGGGLGLGSMGEGISVSSRGSDVVVTVAGDVLFDSGKATLKDSAKRDLNRLTRTINERFPNNAIRVEGYTDSDPIKKSGWKSNEHLSAERALAVERALVSGGISNSRVYSAAFGPARAKNSKKDSRRVEIVVLAPGF